MTPGPSARFPRSARVRSRVEYTRVFDGGRRLGDPLMALHWLPGGQTGRLGLAVSRKVDLRAVGRNRIKRILRETTRHLRNQLQPGDYVIVARPAAAKASHAQLAAAFVRLLRKAGALPVPGAGGTMRTEPLTNPPSESKPDLSAG
jgi:ribonuclease P protein component